MTLKNITYASRYPFNFQNKKAVEIKELWERGEATGQGWIHEVAQARTSDGAIAIRVFDTDEAAKYAVFAPGWKVNRHDSTRLRQIAKKRVGDALACDKEANARGEKGYAYDSLMSEELRGGLLPPVSYPRRLTSNNYLETYLFILDGVMEDEKYPADYWREFILKCKERLGITLDDIYRVASSYKGKRLSLELLPY